VVTVSVFTLLYFNFISFTIWLFILFSLFKLGIILKYISIVGRLVYYMLKLKRVYLSLRTKMFAGVEAVRKQKFAYAYIIIHIFLERIVIGTGWDRAF